MKWSFEGGRFLRALVVFLTLEFAAPVHAAEVILSNPGTDGWHALEFPSIARHTSYTVVHIDGIDALKAHGDCSASSFYLPVDHIDLARTPRLRWKWKIEQGLQVANERVKAGDDFAARVYVLFRFAPEHASVWERVRHTFATKRYGDIIPGSDINYVWSSREPVGTRWDNPYATVSKMVSLGSGATSEWIEQSVDVAADYVSLFGYSPPPPLAVAVMTDSDNSCQQATAYYADFRFVDR